MGSSLSLLALHTADPESALAALRLARTGRSAAFGEGPFTGCATPKGWYLVAANRCDHDMLRHAVLAELSKRCPLVACSIEEHVMFSSAESWAEGRLVWRAEHSGENGPIDLKTSGVLPPFFQPLAHALIAQQTADGGDDSEVDYYFEIPLSAAKVITGFKHDELVPGVDFGRFELLQALQPPPGKKPWWRFW